MGIIVGLVAGVLGKLIMPGRDPGGIVVTILIGMVGAVVGGFVVQGLLGLRGRVRLVDRDGDPGGDHTTRRLPSAGGSAQGLNPLSVGRKARRKRGVPACQD